MPKKQIETFEGHWRTRHRRALDAAHKRILAPLCDSYEIGLGQDDLFTAAEAYEKAMGVRIHDDDERNWSLAGSRCSAKPGAARSAGREPLLWCAMRLTSR
jgi:hypothetical protein